MAYASVCTATALTAARGFSILFISNHLHHNASYQNQQKDSYYTCSNVHKERPPFFFLFSINPLSFLHFLVVCASA